jgi:gliding motility-associated-like protein
MRKFLLFVFTFISYQCFGQGNMITINASVPSQLTVCGVSKTFTISIYNPSPFLLTQDTLLISMPTGIAYQAGSVVGATESNISVTNHPVFLLPNIPTLTTVQITFTAAATCDVLAFLSGGGIVENNIRVNYFANGTATFDTRTTTSYIVRQPNLSISNISNQSYNGSIGGSFSRCVTVTNGGLGELSQFTLTDVHGSGIQITAASPGTWVNSGATETITLGGAEFAAIGDHDTLFENGESIIVCESVSIINCISVASTFEAYWGCNNQHCQSSVSNANVVFPNLIPNLVFTPIPSINTCIGAGNANLQQLKIVNTGLGKAMNVQLDIFQTGGSGSGYQTTVGSYFDTASFTVQTGANGATTPVTFSGTYATATLSCMTNPKGRVTFSIVQINPGDTIYVKWNTYNCCDNECTNVGNIDIDGWRYKGTYQNICQSTYITPEAWGRVYSRLRAGVSNNGSPSTLTNGQVGAFNFLFSYYENSYPTGPGAYWKVEFTLPPCLSYTNGFQILRSNGINTWLPTSVTTVGNVVTAIFNGAPPWSLLQAQVMLNLTVDCSTCGGSSSGSLGIKVSYVPNNTCACEVVTSCQSTGISVICPSPCPEGMVFNNFDMKRTSYGLPDNEANGGNGLADTIGSLDFSKIKTDRAMFGDTITATYNGTVKTSLAYPSWQYCFATASISNGNRLTFLDATLSIYRAGVLIATCNTFTPTITNGGSTRTFKYNLSVPSVGACLSGFTYQNNDSVIFKPRYRVSSNIGNATPINCYSTNEYYMSDIANPTSAANKFQCNNFNGNCSIIGYYFTNYGSDSWIVKSCDNIAVSQNYYLSIGPCCNNYAGGNLFPYEYRNWSHIQTLTAIVPHGYDFISAQFNQVRTSGTIATNTSAWVPVSPLNMNSDTLQFNVEPNFVGYGGTIPLSDDGYHGTLQVTIRPSCRVTPVLAQPIVYNWMFNPTSYLTGTGSAATTVGGNNDTIAYDAPNLFLQSTLPSINAPDLLANWDISISNTSNTSNALNTWLSGPVISGVTITQVFDLDNNVLVLPVGSIYQIGTVNATAVRHFRITASYTSCAKDSIVVYSGWNCNAGYPSSVNTYPCTPKSIKLSLTPLMPSLVTNITAPLGTIHLCDTAIYTIEGINVQLGTSYNNLLTAILPQGVDIVPGSTQFSYPETNPFVVISDPTFMGGTTWQWDISAIDSTIGADGMKGITQLTLNKFKLLFNVITNCGYTSGSTIAFSLMGKAACGQPTGQEVSLSSQLGITGATTPYYTSIRLSTTYISPCAANSTMLVSVKNLGPQAFGTTDSVTIQLPSGVTFVNGTFGGIHNSPLNGTPVQYTLNGSQYLLWKLPAGVVSGDSTAFSFNYKGDPTLLNCDIKEFGAKTTTSTIVTCSQTGSNCGINITTGDTTLSVFTYKAYLSLSNGQTLSVPNPPTGETVTISFDITNTGQAILSGASSIVQFYYDANSNSAYDPGDVFLTQDTLLISNNGTVHFTKTFTVAAGQACSIIATVRDAVNPCVCNPSHLTLSLGLITLGNDTTICSGQTMGLGKPPVTGYTYSWTPITGLSNASLANPVLTGSNSTNAPVATNYILSTNRMGCITKDTIQITVNPLPISNAGTDTTVCPTIAVHAMGAANRVGYSYSWTPATGLSSTNISNPSASLSTPGTTTYTVTTTALGCVSQDSAVMKVNPLPTATIDGSTVVCKNAAAPNITFIGANGTSPYTFTYKINGGSNQTVVTTSGNSVTVAVSTTTAGTFVYSLVSVQDASSTHCSQNQTDSVTVIVSPLPTATISGTTVVCQNDTSALITFVGANGTAPYIFTYNINGGVNQTASTTNGDSLIMLPPTSFVGTSIYNLISVKDGSLATCSQSQSDSAIVTVNPLPIATITGTTAVCKNGTSPSVIFKGANGTGPYTFTYAINNVTQPAVVSTNDTVAVMVPTAVAGTFIYSLVSVTDSSVTACSNSVNENVVITINPLPTATITAPASACVTQSQPSVTFTGANGTAPYTINYTINGGLIRTVITTGSSASVLVPTTAVDSFVYALVSISDASSLTCSQAQTDSVVIKINPLPIPDFNFQEVCLHQMVDFTDMSTVAGGTVVSWLWNFNDNNNLSTSQNPNYLFGSLGTHSVMLKVTSDKGCSDSIAKNTIVHPLPNPAFSTANVCDGDTAHFTDLSSIPLADTLQSWIWNFNDNSSLAFNQDTAHVFPSAGSFPVQLTVQSKFGCIDSISKTIVVNPKPVVRFTTNDTIGCELYCVAFQDASGVFTGSIVQWAWDAGDNTPASTVSSFEHCYSNNAVSNPISYSVSLTATSDSGCVSSLTKPNYITVYPLPEANFAATPLVASIMQSTITIADSSMGADFWNWNFGDNMTDTAHAPKPHTYADTGSYLIMLVVSTDYGCKDTAYENVLIMPDFAFYIPNAFTPDGDGLNDTFSGKGIYILEYEMMIFDRWGNLIYQTVDYNHPWNGIANGGTEIAQRDVYVYVIKVKDIFMNEHKYRGTVTLVK